MKKLLFFLALAPVLSFGQVRKCCMARDSTAIRQQAMDSIASVADYGHSVMTITSGGGGVYKETALTNLCASGDEVMGLKAFGNNKPSPSNLLYKGNLSFTPAVTYVWSKDYSTTSLAGTYIDRGHGNKFLRVFNSPLNTSYWETDPGSFSAKTEPLDFVLALFYLPHTTDEGVNRVKTLGNLTEHISAIDGWTPDINTANGVTYNYYINNVLRILVKADNTYQVWINGVSVGTGTGIDFSTTEWIWGTSSHAMQAQIQYNIVKFGQFTTQEVNTIYRNSQIIWPWKKPLYPLVTGIYTLTFNSGTKTWSMPAGTFTSLTGTAATFEYLWYYWDANDATNFPSADGVLGNNRQIPASVDISSMGSGNSVTSISMDGVNLCSPCGTWATSTTATADAIVALINSNQTAYVAERKSTGVIRFHPNGAGCNNYRVNDVSITASGFSPTNIDAPRTATLNRTTYAGTGQIFNGHTGDSSLKILCVVTPIDTSGARGEPQPTRIITDDTP